jgi:hypothetical protein
LGDGGEEGVDDGRVGVPEEAGGEFANEVEVSENKGEGWLGWEEGGNEREE